MIVVPKLDISKVEPERILGNRHPHLVEEWHPTKNGDLTPFDVTFGEGRMVWWLCSKCGYEWDALISNRSNGKGCPACSGKVVTERNNLGINYPHLAKEWHPTKNGKLTPYDVPFGRNEKAWWLCSKCSYEWDASICNRSNGRGCPKCNSYGGTSRPEKIIAYYFSKCTEVETQYKLPGTKMLLDVYLPSMKVGIEYDGEWSHQEIEKDIRKDKSCKKLGIQLYRIREIGCPELNSTSIVHHVNPRKDYAELQEIIKLLVKNLFRKELDINIYRDRCEIDELSLRDYKQRSLEAKRPELCKEWHPTKNGERMPKHFPYKSDSYVWWKCNECEHEWEANIKNRSNGKGCPECAKKKRWETRRKNKLLKEQSSLQPSIIS